MGSSATVTMDLSRKTATVDRVVAFREFVQVTVKDAAAYIAGGLVLAILRRNKLCATCQSWVANGYDAVGTLNLNTVEMMERFAGSDDQARKVFSLVLLVLQPESTLVNAPMVVMNTPFDTGMPAPNPCEPWPDIPVINAAIAVLQSTTVVKGSLGYTVGASGGPVRAIDGGDAINFNQLLQFVVTLAADLQSKGVI